jgi:seryl-tRNA synthetase
MLDVHFVRANLDLVKQKLEQRGFDLQLLAKFSELDERRRALVRLRDDLNARRNSESQEIGILMKSGQKDQADTRRAAVRERGDQITAVDADLKVAESDLDALLSTVPNLPHDSVPVGRDESANQVINTWGEPPQFAYDPKDHVDLATALGMLDLERAAKISGARFAVLTGAGAQLERALINFCLEMQTRQHGYREVLPPFMVNPKTLFGTGQLPKFESDLFKLTDERNLYLIPTAEVPLTNLFSEEILDVERLPIKMTAYTPCFRSEAGSYGKDTRGLIRQHQFDKVELVKITRPEDSYEELESMTRDAERILEELGLAYRRVALSTGDMGFSAAKTFDIEVWIPSQKTYREISSCSNCESFQARRAQIRFRREQKAKPEFVHTLNGSGLAIGRLWVAIVENFQQEDGSVELPEVLRPFMGGLQRITTATK